VKAMTKRDDVTYMDCWHFVAPLIPITQDPLTTQIYVMIFSALKDADDKKIGKDNKSNEK
jgi:hypothetical protein